MPSCNCQHIKKLFGPKRAAGDLAKYKQLGLPQTTSIMLDEIIKLGVKGRTVLDIGGGMGSITLELLAAGAKSTTSVEASPHFIKVAQSEAARLGFADRANFITGDFVAQANKIPAFDIVTLDKAICCYADMESLVNLSAAHTNIIYAAIFPRDTWWVKVLQLIPNLIHRLRKLPLFYIHPVNDIAAILEQHGFTQHFQHHKGQWQITIWRKS